jgi:hypothetical protein
MKADHAFKLDETFPKWHGWHAATAGLGSNLYALGIPEKVIQQILRYANVNTTKIYYIKTSKPLLLTLKLQWRSCKAPVPQLGNEWATVWATICTFRKLPLFPKMRGILAEGFEPATHVLKERVNSDLPRIFNNLQRRQMMQKQPEGWWSGINKRFNKRWHAERTVHRVRAFT